MADEPEIDEAEVQGEPGSPAEDESVKELVAEPVNDAPPAGGAAPTPPASDPSIAVLTENRWPLLDGQLVTADEAAIAALIAAGGARAATAPEIEAARPFIHPLPPEA